MQHKDRLINLVLSRIENLACTAKELSLLLHRHPEISGQEKLACQTLSDYLIKQGFSVQTPLASLPTAFKAQAGQGQRIAFIAEYDALPEIGHGCGHNLIAAASALAASALLPVCEHAACEISVIGTPAEEHGSYKIKMIEKGIFNGIDIALLAHPSAQYDSATIQTYALAEIEVIFYGKAAHAASTPAEGINALDAIILSFNAINALRQQLPENCRVHGIITHGGDAANIIPEKASATFMVRSRDGRYLHTLVQRITDIFEGAARQTGATLNIKMGKVCLNMKNNLALANAYVDTMKKFHREVPLYEDRLAFGSTDMGNLSQVLPAIHPVFCISQQECPSHTREFAQLAGLAESLNEMVLAAKGSS